ncbi:heterokaryon incompatibility protein-domain-containing protein [Leptodontidium sp. MPI-SDFR-AT-0119]|nr:heterokaryon incompatibility protein-domain-containing protein [Leptodontidium sp. MPI-SDFR-AT-0119]
MVVEEALVILLFVFLIGVELLPWCPTLATAIFIHYITPWLPSIASFYTSWVIENIELFWQDSLRFFYSIRIGYPVILLGIVRNKSFEPEPTFQYSDLAEGYIRLLSIQGINLKSARHVFNLKLCDFPLHELPPYYAVSYTWDSQPNSHLIRINNQWLSASSNVSSILSLFAPMVFGQRYLWIDAICINQTNKVEKATQVKLMRDIYRNAKSVLVWLSSENLNQDSQRDNQNILSVSARRLYVTCQDLLNRVMPLELTNLDGMLVHRYWRRVWIIQEFVVSSQLEVYFRGRYIDWRCFTSLLKSRVFKNMHSRIHSNPTDMTYGLHQISTLMDIRGEFLMGERYQIQNLLHRFGGSQATDPRDKVFALQGLAAPTSLKTPSASKSTEIMIDYTTSARELFIHVARVLLQQKQQEYLDNLLLAAGIGWKGRIRGLPSWVTDWTDFPEALLGGFTRKPYDVGPNGFFQAACSAQSTLLYVHNTELVDEIAVMTCEIDHDSWKDSDWYSSQAHWFTQLCNIVQDQLSVLRRDQLDDDGSYSRDYRRCPGRWRGAICRTLLAIPNSYWGLVPGNCGARTFIRPDELTEEQLSNWISGEGKSPLRPESFHDYLHTEDDDLYESLEFLSQLPRLQNQVTQPNDTTSRLFRRGIEFLQKCRPHTQGRRFALTSTGYMCLVPPKAKVGDKIAFITGTNLPHVLRESFERPSSVSENYKVYQLVGNCFAFGLMYGTGYMERGTETPKTIVLK